MTWLRAEILISRSPAIAILLAHSLDDGRGNYAGQFFLVTLEAQLPIYWVLVLGSLYRLILSMTQEPTIWVPGLLGLCIAPTRLADRSCNYSTVFFFVELRCCGPYRSF